MDTLRIHIYGRQVMVLGGTKRIPAGLSLQVLRGIVEQE